MQNHTEKIKKVFSFYYLIRTKQISSKVIGGWVWGFFLESR